MPALKKYIKRDHYKPLSLNQTMTKVKHITAQIEELCPLTYAEDFDNVGLLVGDDMQTVTGVLVALDCLESTVDEAIKHQCNLIVSFHPIIFKGLKKLNGKNYVERAVIKAIKNDIAIYAMHTALDNSFKGVSAKMAEMLDLENTQVLMPQKGHLRKLTTYAPENAAEEIRTALFEAGAGHIGNYSHCSFTSEGTGSFIPGQEANPAVGSRGDLQLEPEVQVHITFTRDREKEVSCQIARQTPGLIDYFS